jgi:hypothetical protein
MAIGPHQLNEAFNREVDAYEARIDSELAKKSIGMGGTVSVDFPSGISSLHLQILRQRYLSVGWKEVKENHDQREGSWLTFKS